MSSVSTIALVVPSTAMYDSIVRTTMRPSAGCSSMGGEGIGILASVSPVVGSIRVTRSTPSCWLTHTSPNPVSSCHPLKIDTLSAAVAASSASAVAQV